MTITYISIAGANCPTCFQETMDSVRQHPQVVAVSGSLAEQQLQVEHFSTDPSWLLDLVRNRLHADAVFGLERVMNSVDPLVTSCGCDRHSVQ